MVEHASPALAAQVESVLAGRRHDVRLVRRVVVSVVRYLVRATGRPTPFGLFAGVAPVTLGEHLNLDWGEGHRVVARPDAAWLEAVIARVEALPLARQRLLVAANNLCIVRAGRLVVPVQSVAVTGSCGATAQEVSIRYSRAVRLVMELTRAPIRWSDLAEKVNAEFPGTCPATVATLLSRLLCRRVLLSCLRAPSTVTDPFEYLVDQLVDLDPAGATDLADIAARLRPIRSSLHIHNAATIAQSRRIARQLAGADMLAVVATDRQPVAVDTVLACTLTLPRTVAREVQDAAAVLARLSVDPFGTVAWQDYHVRFFERYGIGALVALRELVDPDMGLGFPAGYPGSTAPVRRLPITHRDELLLALAQQAALDGAREVVLDQAAINDLAHPDAGRAHHPPHVEVRFQIHAVSAEALHRGGYTIAVAGLSRGVGTMNGRFLRLLDPTALHRARRTFTLLPASDPDTIAVQLSFSPLDPSAGHVTRVPAMLATVSLGEYPAAAGGTTISLDDLVVGCDGHRMYVASLSQRQRIEPTILHALQLRGHTPALARFLAEIGKAQAAVVNGFDWGAAARLPFLPRLRYGRLVLSPARWLIDQADLPARDEPVSAWDQTFAVWATRRHLPGDVYLAEGDRQLRLGTDLPAHRAILRIHLDNHGQAVLTEAPDCDAYGWFDGRAHEIVAPLVAAAPPRWPHLPEIYASRVIARDHGHLPGTSRWLYVKLFAHPQRHPQILAEHLPRLLAAWNAPARGWLRTAPSIHGSGVLTAWFNPWSHQSGEQVWAGLARTIMEAAEEVLFDDGPLGGDARRHGYWFGRNLPRLDRRAVQTTLRRRLLSPLLKTGAFALLIPLVVKLIDPASRFRIFDLPVHGTALALALSFTLITAGLLHTVGRYFFAAAAGYLPADLLRGPVLSGPLGAPGTAPTEPLRDPLYHARSGYLYLVQHDIQELLKDLERAGCELVVFIDDLDRCTPATTRDVFEAISIFLSGDFPAARFVIGLDPVVVAAHMNDAFTTEASDVRHIDDPSPGWSYLRKLVQLPILLPAVPDRGVERLLDATLGHPNTVARLSPVNTALPDHAAPVSQPPATPFARETDRRLTGDPVGTDPLTDVLEEHPRLRDLVRERLLAQSERSVREAKRLLTVWQFYSRVLDLIDSLTGEAAVNRACKLVILAEIITRWPAMQHRLHGTIDGQRGLQILAEATDEPSWAEAIAKVRLDQPQYTPACCQLRDLLIQYDGVSIAALAARLL